MKAIVAAFRGRQLGRELLAVVGIGLLVAGVDRLFGPGWALVALGGACVLWAVRG